MEMIGKTAWNFFSSLVSTPLHWVYLSGPSFFGFWESQREADICAALTHADASFWLNSAFTEDMCHELILRKAKAFIIGTLFVSTSLLLTLFVAASLCRVVLVDPLVSAIANPNHHVSSN